jgi:hypothetical protein
MLTAWNGKIAFSLSRFPVSRFCCRYSLSYLLFRKEFISLAKEGFFFTTKGIVVVAVWMNNNHLLFLLPLFLTLQVYKDVENMRIVNLCLSLLFIVVDCSSSSRVRLTSSHLDSFCSEYIFFGDEKSNRNGWMGLFMHARRLQVPIIYLFISSSSCYFFLSSFCIKLIRLRRNYFYYS